MSTSTISIDTLIDLDPSERERLSELFEMSNEEFNSDLKNYADVRELTEKGEDPRKVIAERLNRWHSSSIPDGVSITHSYTSGREVLLPEGVITEQLLTELTELRENLNQWFGEGTFSLRRTIFKNGVKHGDAYLVGWANDSYSLYSEKLNDKLLAIQETQKAPRTAALEGLDIVKKFVELDHTQM